MYERGTVFQKQNVVPPVHLLSVLALSWAFALWVGGHLIPQWPGAGWVWV